MRADYHRRLSFAAAQAERGVAAIRLIRDQREMRFPCIARLVFKAAVETVSRDDEKETLRKTELSELGCKLLSFVSLSFG